MKHLITKKHFESELNNVLDNLCSEILSSRYFSDVSHLELKKNKLTDIKKSLAFIDEEKFAKHSRRLQRIFNQIVYPDPLKVRA